MQYAGLFLYVLAEAVIFLPLLHFAANASRQFWRDERGRDSCRGGHHAADLRRIDGDRLRQQEGFFVPRRHPGHRRHRRFCPDRYRHFVWYESGRLVHVGDGRFRRGYILYYTSNILHQYRTDQYVAAALALFASVALLFWYVIQIFMASRD